MNYWFANERNKFHSTLGIPPLPQITLISIQQMLLLQFQLLQKPTWRTIGNCLEVSMEMTQIVVAHIKGNIGEIEVFFGGIFEEE